jgi:hypothetical protein
MNTQKIPFGMVGRFFFSPTDPTTIGFMRIIVGLLILYTHLAYSFDLQNFMGPKAWWDQDAANRQRREIPTWVSPLGYEKLESSIKLEETLHRRDAVIDFLRNLPESTEDRKKALRALETIFNQNMSEQDRALTLLNTINNTTEEAKLKEIATMLAQPSLVGVELPITIPPFMEKMTPQARVQFWNDLNELWKLIPNDSPDKFEYVMLWLMNYGSWSAGSEKQFKAERMDLVNYLTGTKKAKSGKNLGLPTDPEIRKEYLSYLQTWGSDPRQPASHGIPVASVWFHLTNPTAMWVMHVIFLCIFAMFTVGLFTRVTSILTWIGTLCYIQRSQHILFGEDTMQTLLIMYCTLGPSGAALSIDALRKRYRASKALLAAGGQPVPWAESVLAGPQPSWLANFFIRMIQIHFCIIYLSSGLSKLKGTAWWDHSAGWMVMVNPEFGLVRYKWYESLMHMIADYPVVAAGVEGSISIFTLILEVSLPFFVWTRLRPLAVCGSIMLHTGIAMMMGLSVFALYMMALLLAYIPGRLIREKVGFAKGSGRKLTVTYDSRSASAVKSVAAMRAFDVADQVTLHDVALERGPVESEVTVTREDGHHQDLYYTLWNDLVLLRPVRWIGLIPGSRGLFNMAFGSRDPHSTEGRMPVSSGR